MVFSFAGDRRLRPIRLSAVSTGAEYYYLELFNTIYLRRKVNLIRNFLIKMMCVFDVIAFILIFNFDPKFNSRINFHDVYIASLKNVKR